MLEFTIDKPRILNPLLLLSGVVDKKQSLPVLSNILLQFIANRLLMRATDLEIEMTAALECPLSTEHAVTIPARKLLDIIRSLDDSAPIKFTHKENYFLIQSQRSRFKLQTLPADDFPIGKTEANIVDTSVQRRQLQPLLQMTYFAMSHQDVRVYLNGLLLEFDNDSITAVATDGHRMAISKLQLTEPLSSHRIIIPRKGVLEILRLLSSIDDDSVRLLSGDGHLSIETSSFTFLTKLVESRYPAYSRVLPRHLSTFALIDKDTLKRALNRITILAHEKTKAIIMALETSSLCLIAANQQQEEATEEIEAQLDGPPIRIKINAAYLIDVINHIPEGLLRLSFADADSSILLESLADEAYQYVIMPMKI